MPVQIPQRLNTVFVIFSLTCFIVKIFYYFLNMLFFLQLSASLLFNTLFSTIFPTNIFPMNSKIILYFYSFPYYLTLIQVYYHCTPPLLLEYTLHKPFVTQLSYPTSHNLVSIFYHFICWFTFLKLSHSSYYFFLANYLILKILTSYYTINPLNIHYHLFTTVNIMFIFERLALYFPYVRQVSQESTICIY